MSFTFPYSSYNLYMKIVLEDEKKQGLIIDKGQQFVCKVTSTNESSVCSG